jgi:acetyl-CoA acetyltransferase
MYSPVKLMGSLKDFSGSDLGAIAIAGALEKGGVPASVVDYVIMGQVLTAGRGRRWHRLGRARPDDQQDVPSTKELPWIWPRVNVDGGAIAIGHPIGMSGCADHPARGPRAGTTRFRLRGRGALRRRWPG